MSDLNNQTLTSNPVQGTPVATGELDDLLKLMARLRADCPWDKKQSNHRCAIAVFKTLLGRPSHHVTIDVKRQLS